MQTMAKPLGLQGTKKCSARSATIKPWPVHLLAVRILLLRPPDILKPGDMHGRAAGPGPCIPVSAAALMQGWCCWRCLCWCSSCRATSSVAMR